VFIALHLVQPAGNPNNPGEWLDSFKLWIEVFELDAGIGGGEAHLPWSDCCSKRRSLSERSFTAPALAVRDQRR
jgi:hypothetical protein